MGGPPMGGAGGQDATMNGKSHKPKKPHGSAPNSQDTASRKQHQPLSAISIQDLNSVQVSDRPGPIRPGPSIITHIKLRKVSQYLK